MVAVIGIVSLMLVIIAVATSAVFGTVLQDNLNAKLQTTQQQTGQVLLQLQYGPPGEPITAYDVLEAGREQPGTLLIVRAPEGTTTGAVVASDTDVETLSDEQVDAVVEGISQPEHDVDVPGLGEYRVTAYQAQSYVAVAGLPLSEVQTTITQMLTTMLLVTAGGLLLLAAVIALVIRASLAPLRAVADTATRVAAMPMSEGAVTISERVPGDQADEHTEIGRVGHALNTLLDHVDESLDARQRNEERMRRFVADASHELRTPLASIRGYSELSLRAPDLSENTESSLERIQAQSLRMTTLVEDLLLLARLDEGQELVYGSVDLSQLAIEAVADARPAGPDHIWQLDLGEDPVVVAGDAVRLHQVAANLLANARTHTPAGTTVTVSVHRADGQAVLRVHDDGPGVDPAIADDLFERFSRADRSRARKTGGTGLGLSIAKAIVDAHGGTLSVQSTPGDTTFELRLPARPADAAEA
ncbi:HAMP domain-containing histidine kinase [Microbacterium terricola]|nr:HAMP domain-containing sensor histidine kinase [Microbacterium terricola]UYK41566.1 HAMP domain-containing histidine kinase [Microbacterium terricola]